MYKEKSTKKFALYTELRDFSLVRDLVCEHFKDSGSSSGLHNPGQVRNREAKNLWLVILIWECKLALPPPPNPNSHLHSSPSNHSSLHSLAYLSISFKVYHKSQSKWHSLYKSRFDNNHTKRPELRPNSVHLWSCWSLVVLESSRHSRDHQEANNRRTKNCSSRRAVSDQRGADTLRFPQTMLTQSDELRAARWIYFNNFCSIRKIKLYHMKPKMLS